MVNSPLFWSLAMYHANWARWICIYHTCCKNKGDPLPEGFRLPLLGCMFPIWPNSYHSLWPVWMTCLLFLYFSPHAIYLHIYTLLSFFSLHRQHLYCACMHVWSLLTFLSPYILTTRMFIFGACFALFIYACLKFFSSIYVEALRTLKKMAHSSPAVSTDHALVRY